MYNEPLTFDVVPGKTADTRIFQLHGPITLSTLFDFQKVLMGGTEKVTILDFTDSPYMDSIRPGWALFSISMSRPAAAIVISGWWQSITGSPSCSNLPVPIH
jgi:hypothetical protein